MALETGYPGPAKVFRRLLDSGILDAGSRFETAFLLAGYRRCGQHQPGRELVRSLAVCGTHICGNLHSISTPDFLGNFDCAKQGASAVLPVFAGHSTFGESQEQSAALHQTGLPHGSRRENLFEAFYRSIMDDEPLPIPYREILLSCNIMDAIFAQLGAKQSQIEARGILALHSGQQA